MKGFNALCWLVFWIVIIVVVCAVAFGACSAAGIIRYK